VLKVRIWPDMRSRKLSVVSSSMASPMMANWGGNSPSHVKLYRAGINRRLVRSPDAPKMTMMQGSPCALAAGAVGAEALTVRRVSMVRVSLEEGRLCRPCAMIHGMIGRRARDRKEINL